MSTDRVPGHRDDDRETDLYDDAVSPRSLWQALWVRVVLALVILGVVAVFTVPYVRDFATTPAVKATASSTSTPAMPAVAAPTIQPRSAPAPALSTLATPAPKPAQPAASAPKRAPEPPAKRVVAAKAVDVAKPAAKATAPKKAVEPDAPSAAATAPSGPYWIQVGAFKDAEAAKRLAARLREQGLRVEESAIAAAPAVAAAAPEASPADRYDVVVAGASLADVDAKVAVKGLVSEATANGTVIRPSLPLREAVALSRDLADAGLSVQVRRVDDTAAATTPAPNPTLHRVRVGGFADRAAAAAALRTLEAKGYKPFIARGTP